MLRSCCRMDKNHVSRSPWSAKASSRTWMTIFLDAGYTYLKCRNVESPLKLATRLHDLIYSIRAKVRFRHHPTLPLQLLQYLDFLLNFQTHVSEVFFVLDFCHRVIFAESLRTKTNRPLIKIPNNHMNAPNIAPNSIWLEVFHPWEWFNTSRLSYWKGQNR